jgi:hypothetical protein
MMIVKISGLAMTVELLQDPITTLLGAKVNLDCPGKFKNPMYQ